MISFNQLNSAMQLSTKTINSTLKKELTQTLYQLIADLKHPDEAKDFLDAFLSPSEQLALLKRVSIAYYLKKGRGYKNIKNNLKVSSATIAGIQELLETHKGAQVVLKKIEADQWADQWSQKIRKLISQ